MLLAGRAGCQSNRCATVLLRHGGAEIVDVLAGGKTCSRSLTCTAMFPGSPSAHAHGPGQVELTDNRVGDP
jgi:hypothetical protein